MSEKSPYPNFHQPFDSRPTPEATQRQRATREFNNLFDDLMLAHVVDAVRQAPPAGPDRGVVCLDLTAKIGNQQFIINLAEKMALDSTQWRDSEEYSRSIDLGDSAGNCWGYYLGRDDVIRRLDTHRRRL